MTTSSRSLLRNGLLIVIAIALLKLLAHLLTGGAYGYFRDEFYYIAASKRLALGYVDFPLFIAWLTAFVRATLGESLLALRLLPEIAGALEFFGGEQLPPVISGHNSYFLWGPQGCDGRVVIFAPGYPADAAESFGRVERAAVKQCRYCMPYENGQPILVARDPKFTNIQDVWPGAKSFN